MEKYKVGIIGATGMVGQRFAILLENHPWFQLTVIAASPRSAGKTYAQAVSGRWAMQTPIPAQAKVVVEGVNMVTCHTKPRRQGEEGGIVRREAALYASKVQVVCPKCGKGTRVAHKIENGKKSRVCKHCGAEL